MTETAAKLATTLTREDVEELRSALDDATEARDNYGISIGFSVPITPFGRTKLIAALGLASQSLSREAEIRREVIEECARASEDQAEFIFGDAREETCHHIAKIIRAMKEAPDAKRNS